MHMNGEPKRKRPSFAVIAMFVMPAVIIAMIVVLLCLSGKPVTYSHTASSLTETKEISSMYLAEFIYNGIADLKKDKTTGEYILLNREDKSTPDLSLYYNSTVKVSVDPNTGRVEVDDEKQTVTVEMPVFTLETPVVDPGSIKIINGSRNLYPKDMIAYCREDVRTEAAKSEMLMECAEDNWKSVIRSWYAPLFPGYGFVFPDDVAGEE